MNDDKKNGEDANVMEQFFTADKASVGVKLYLEDALGVRTDQWIRIRGADSEEFRLAELAAKREAVMISGTFDDKERDQKAIDLSRRTAATLVMEWSFPMPCTLSNVVEFFKKAPQIQNKVDQAAASRRLFYMVVSDNSTPISAQSTDST